MTTIREIEAKLRDLKDDVEQRDVPDIIIRDSVVETSWSDADGREVPSDSVTRLRWDGGSWEEVET